MLFRPSAKELCRYTLRDRRSTPLGREVLQGSIDAGGAPFELSLPTRAQRGGWDDPYLFHWEERAPCPVCGTPLPETRTGSTGSYICPGCQRLEPSNRLG